jgi:hypothetical protein
MRTHGGRALGVTVPILLAGGGDAMGPLADTGGMVR